MTKTPVLEIRDLQTHFGAREGLIKAVDGVSMTVNRGETLAVVGESGCGKSITAWSVMNLVPKPGKIVGGSINLYDRNGGSVDIAALDPKSAEMRAIRGARVAMIFQEPMTSLSPVHTIGNQIVEMIRLHQPVTKKEAEAQAVRMLDRVGIPKPTERMAAYPFQMSGGMRQRVVIAMALSCNADLLIADEPTTALDVTTQANILELMKELQAEHHTSMILITHDLGVVAEVADEVAVMYLGRAVEQTDVFTLFDHAQHPYSRALLGSIPELGKTRGQRLTAIRGMIPHPLNRPLGCTFNTRCPMAIKGACDAVEPDLIQTGPHHHTRCLAYQNGYTHHFDKKPEGAMRPSETIGGRAHV
ncbi:ABC transporter ATP-binding protein [Pseudaestuariivita rosea]|uniref:ABC transporter ATP-binding protein n=1 Tax=Pseudaestuariivita rosea TaxID=2763263 RepID=UPI001ABA6605|nr:ABC transporter ATP-binding protein [Pseudaestuariivita rosea]